MMRRLVQSEALDVLVSSGVFVFFAAMFAVPSGYSYGGGLLLVAALWYLACCPKLGIDSDDRRLAGVLLAYFVVSTGMTISLGNNLKDLDQYGRALLAVPVLLLCCSRIRIRLPVVWTGIALGAILSAPLAWWQVVANGDTQAGGFMNEISFSNLVWVFAIFCAGGLFWAVQQNHARLWLTVLAAGLLCGLYSAIVGGSRGTWVAVPPGVLLFLFAFLERKNAVRVLVPLVLGGLILAALFTVSDSPLRVRYEAGVQNVTQIEDGNSANSIGARMEMWRGAWMSLQEKPVLGWNMADYAAKLRSEVSSGEVAPIVLHYTDNLHNNYFQAWVFTGLPGLLALLALYAVPLWHFARRLRDADLTVRVLAFCGSSLVVSFLCFSLTYSALRRNYGIMFYLLSLVVFWGTMKQARIQSSRV
jgi:O-antigen ligase